MAKNAEFKFKMNRGTLDQIRAAAETGVREVFELDMKPDAMQNAPVKTGNHRRMIDTEVTSTQRGIEALLFSQSGYGAYLEVGTRFMAARPHLYPAFAKFKDRLYPSIEAQLKKLEKAS